MKAQLNKYIVLFGTGETEPVLALDQEAADKQAHKRAAKKKTIAISVKPYTE
jgi:hypothetical protein